MSSIEKLKFKRATIKRKLTLQLKFVQNPQQIANLNKVSARYENLKSLLDEYTEIYSELCSIIDDGDVENSEHEVNTDFEIFEDSFYDVKGKFEEILNINKVVWKVDKLNMSDDNVTLKDSDADNANNLFSKAKLPEIRIPVFDGKLDDWLRFRDSFEKIIIDNHQINSKIQKMWYLDMFVVGKAKDIIDKIDFSDDGFDIAWQALVDRFDDTHALVEKHISELFKLQYVNKSSSIEIQNLIDRTELNLRALQKLNQNVSQWDMMVIHIVSYRLDDDIRKAWESQLDKKMLPTWKQLSCFLQTRCRVLNIVETNRRPNRVKPSSSGSGYVPKYSKTFITVSKQNEVNTKIVCSMCNGNHSLESCVQFVNLNPEERYGKIRVMGRCLNCLSDKHLVRNCQEKLCEICGYKHHTLLHIKINRENRNLSNGKVPSRHSDNNKNTDSTNLEKIDNINSTQSSSSYLCREIIQNQVVLTTAVILIKDFNQKYIQCRALLDSASHNSFISTDFVNKLGINVERENNNVSGINGTKTNISNSIKTSIHSRINNYSKTIKFLVVSEISNRLPNQYINISKWSVPSNLLLADPDFNIPGPIDILLGSDVFWEILKEGRLELSKDLPVFHNTNFGWVIGGKLETSSNNQNFFLSSELEETDNRLDSLLEKFWNLENCNNDKNKIRTAEELICEQHFSETHKRDKDGKFIVQLPFKMNSSLLGNSSNMAFQRFSILERKLNKNAELKQQYIDFMREYESLGHMKLCSEVDNESGYFIPHLAVLRPDSSTTKCRVVFDASAKSSSMYSLNDLLMVGPVVQEELFSIVLRFRKHTICFSSDIEKMYRMVRMDKSHTKFHKIYWRENFDDDLKIYELQTVTYGTSSAPYLSTRVIQQLAEDESANYPLASNVAKSDFYVDDLLSGCQTSKESILIYDELTKMFSSAGMRLRKWYSNSKILLNHIPTENRGDPNELDVNETIKTLGLRWSPLLDEFTFLVQPIDISNKITKRSILSNISKLFDPLGLLGPVILSAKIIIQNLWIEKLDWDTDIPEHLKLIWINFRSNLDCLNDVKLNRCVMPGNVSDIEIHGFSDASQKAYGACVYLRCKSSDGNVIINLLCSKSRVAPLKVISLPKLELTAILLLVNLINSVTTSLKIHIEKTILWSDSTIALSWLKISPHNLTTYVSNRVNEILEGSRDMKFRHIAGKENPADLVSRGILPHEIGGSDIWWHGPSFLKNDESEWPISKIEISNNQVLPELKSDQLSFISVKTIDIFNIENFSSIVKLKRVVAYSFRFIDRYIRKKNICTGSLEAHEIETALSSIIRTVQTMSFGNEIKILLSKQTLPINSKLISLSAFVDEEGLLRVGGRLDHCNLDYDQKHQIILPKEHNLTRLIIRHEHVKNMHAGVQSTLAAVRQKYWIINGKDTVRRVIKSCVPCFKFKPKLEEQIMASLPPDRLNAARPFNIVGVDFCGPFMVKYKGQRKDTQNKVYVCIFVCFVCKAVHLELVEDATSKSFIECLKRFFSRRGRSAVIYSDNAGNFVGANTQVKEMESLVRGANKEVQSFYANEGITWKYIPPRSPHFGGLWEAAVKLFKSHMKKVVGCQVLTLEQLSTLVIEIEGILNSRPLSPLSSDPRDFEPLTPGHFTTGGPINTILHVDVTNVVSNRLSYWKQKTQLVQHFWKRFSKEYLQNLQQRTKWKFERENLQIDDLVLIYEDNIPSSKWLMGRVEKTILGRDNKVRVVVIRTPHGILERAITKVCKLPIN